jgi:ElaB/YqjD/DUF883 family membrane-anchored ribosome-binding protein
MTIKLASASFLVVIAGSGAAIAQDAAAPVAQPPAYIAAEAPEQYLARDRLITTKVKSPDGMIIGDIEDIILSGDHKVIGVIMGTGGYFGLFEKKVGVDISALQFDVVDSKIEATLPSYTKDNLDAAPEFVRNQPQKSLFVRAVEKGQEIRDKTGNSAKEAYEAAKENAGPAVEKAKEAAKDAIDKVGPALESAKQKASEVIESAKEKASEAVDKAKDAAEPSTPPETPATPATPTP